MVPAMFNVLFEPVIPVEPASPGEKKREAGVSGRVGQTLSILG